MKKIKLIFLIISALTVLFCGWYLCGMPGGWIPGKYNQETYSYDFLSGGKVSVGKFTNSAGEEVYSSSRVFILGMKSPLGSPDTVFRRYDHYGEERKILLHYPWIRYGLIDSTGRVLKPFVYDEIRRVGNNLMLKKDSLVGFYNPITKKMMIPMEYRGIKYISSNNPLLKNYKYYLLQDKNNLYGMADSTGIIVVPCQYRYYYERSKYIYFYNENFPDGQYPDLYDYTGKKIFSREYENIVTYSPHLPFFEGRKNNKDYFFIDVETMEARKVDFIPLNRLSGVLGSILLIHGIYSDSIHSPILWRDKSTKYKHNKIIAQDGHEYNTHWGVANYSGDLLLPLEYDSIYRTRHDLLFVKKDGKQGLMNRDLEWVVPLKNHQLKIHKMPLIQISKNDLQNTSYCIDLNETVILSNNIAAHNFRGNDNDENHIYFSFKDERARWGYYYLKYDEGKERFYWYRDK